MVAYRPNYSPLNLSIKLIEGWSLLKILSWPICCGQTQPVEDPLSKRISPITRNAVYRSTLEKLRWRSYWRMRGLELWSVATNRSKQGTSSILGMARMNFLLSLQSSPHQTTVQVEMTLQLWFLKKTRLTFELSQSAKISPTCCRSVLMPSPSSSHACRV